MGQESNHSMQSESYLDDTFVHAAIGLAYLNLDGQFLRANKALLEHLGYPLKNLRALKIEEIIHPSDLNQVKQDMDKLVNTPAVNTSSDIRFFDHMGNAKWSRCMLSAINSKQDKALYLVAAIEDISQERQSISKQIINRKLFETIAEKVPTAVWLSRVDLKSMHYVNQEFLDLWQIKHEQVTSLAKKNLLERVHPDDRNRVAALLRGENMDNDDWQQSFRLQRNDGSIIYIESRGTLLRDDDGEPIYLLGTHIDITEQVEYTSRLENLNQELQHAYTEVSRLNQFDTLTGCYNRAAIHEQMNHAKYQYNRYEIPSTVVFIDLNRFKQVNDDYGHHAGDLVLKNFAKYMQEQIRQTDMLGRIGGDEFLLLLPGANRYNAEQFIKKLDLKFNTEISSELTLTTHYAVGLSELNFNMPTIDAWIDQADTAMYAQKSDLYAKTRA